MDSNYPERPPQPAENGSVADPSHLSYSVKSAIFFLYDSGFGKIRVQKKNLFIKCPSGVLKQTLHCRCRYCVHDQNEMSWMMVVKEQHVTIIWERSKFKNNSVLVE